MEVNVKLVFPLCEKPMAGMDLRSVGVLCWFGFPGSKGGSTDAGQESPARLQARGGGTSHQGGSSASGETGFWRHLKGEPPGFNDGRAVKRENKRRVQKDPAAGRVRLEGCVGQIRGSPLDVLRICLFSSNY